MKRLRPFATAQPSSRRSTEKASSKIDQLLQRASHVSQIVLVITAVFTIFYTVIPLYGKAVLEEDIAKKKIELAKTEEALARAYMDLREYTVEEIARNLTRECAYGPPQNLLGKFSPDLWRDQVLGLDRRECAKAVLEHSGLSRLDRKDVEAVETKIAAIDVHIDSLVTRARSDYQRVINLAAKSPDKYIHTDSFTHRALNEVAGAIPQDSLRKLEVDAAISAAQGDVVSNLGREIGQAYRGIRETEWPAPDSEL